MQHDRKREQPPANAASSGGNAGLRSKSERDYGLDLLKGVGCLCMLIGHSGVEDKTDSLAMTIHFLVHVGAIYFFSVAGITTQLQLQRYTVKSLLRTYVLIFLLGYSYSAVRHPDLYHFFTFEIFQIIALGVMATAMVHAFLKSSPATYALLAAVLVALNWLCQWQFPGFHGAGLLLPHERYVPHYLLAQGQEEVFPGFPLLGWLYVFFAGCALYGASRRAGLILALAATIMLVTLESLGIDTRFRDTWAMSPGFTCVSMLALGLGMFFVKSLHGWQPGPHNMLIYFGKNSLQFLYLHVFGIAAVVGCWWAGQYLAWIVGTVVTYFVMKGFERLPHWRRLESITAWYVLVMLCLALPLLMQFGEQWAWVVQIGEGAIGLIFAKNLGLLTRRMKRVPSPADV